MSLTAGQKHGLRSSRMTTLSDLAGKYLYTAFRSGLATRCITYLCRNVCRLSSIAVFRSDRYAHLCGICWHQLNTPTNCNSALDRIWLLLFGRRQHILQTLLFKMQIDISLSIFSENARQFGLFTFCRVKASRFCLLWDNTAWLELLGLRSSWLRWQGCIWL